MRKDIMVDIETLGKDTGASVFQISAMTFNKDTGEIYNEFNKLGAIGSYKELNVDGDTLLWWLNTNKELLTNLLNSGTLFENELISEFLYFLTKESSGNNSDLYLWGNGILFDNVKIKDMCKKYDYLYPIYYRNDRDVRTLLELASEVSGKSEDEIKQLVTNEDEIKHDALDDVRYQVRLVVKCNELIKNKSIDN
jgi:hypothetical protein